MNLTYKLITVSLIACFFGCENDNMKDEIDEEHNHGHDFLYQIPFPVFLT